MGHNGHASRPNDRLTNDRRELGDPNEAMLAARIQALEAATLEAFARVESMLTVVTSRLDDLVSAGVAVRQADVALEPHQEAMAEPQVELAPVAVDNESDLRGFLEESNSHIFSFEELRAWFQERSGGYEAEEMVSLSGNWGLARVAFGQRAWVVPILRTPTAGLPLGDYFTLRQYNGVDPLKPQNIVRLPTQQRVEDQWHTETMGELDGRPS
jgi:hypothetical protein